MSIKADKVESIIDGMLLPSKTSSMNVGRLKPTALWANKKDEN